MARVVSTVMFNDHMNFSDMGRDSFRRTYKDERARCNDWIFAVQRGSHH